MKVLFQTSDENGPTTKLDDFEANAFIGIRGHSTVR